MPVSRRTYLRRRIAVGTALVVLLSAFTYLPITLLAPTKPAVATALSVATPESTTVTVDWPGYGASAIGAVGFPGILATGGETTPRPIASITKIITVLVVLDKKPLAADAPGPNITMTQHDASLYHQYFARNGKVEPVRAGLVLTQRQLLDVVLISSANNYAETLGSWAFGSETAFLAAAKGWLADHQLSNTTLQDSSGMNPGNTSTASDLVELGKLALANPTVAAIVSTKSTTLPYIGRITNTNELLGVDGFEGIKTGTLAEAGACLLFADTIIVDNTPITVVGVVLGGTNHRSLNAAVRALMASAVAGFQNVPLVSAGTPFYVYSTPWDQQARAVATKDESVLVWAGTPVTQRVSTKELTTASAGTMVGSVEFTVAGKTITVPLALDSALSDPGPWWRLTNPFG